MRRPNASAGSFESWGRHPTAPPARVVALWWRDEPLPRPGRGPGLLAHGLGRSYGDVCLNRGGTLVHTRRLDRLIRFDEECGLLSAEAGISLGEILAVIVPRGWFLPVTPGTRHVTLGGAIANDVHGKNHHRAGTFGRYVTRFELLRSSGERLLCAPDREARLFAATIGGLGLTGLITWAEIRLRRIAGPQLDAESVRFGSLEEFYPLAEEADRRHEYTVAWIDALAGGDRLGRGRLLAGDHVEAPGAGTAKGPRPPRLRLALPLTPPSWLLGRPLLRVFNAAYFRAHPSGTRRRLVHYEPFFYPLDRIEGWNRAYGRRGFLQYQCVVPSGAREAVGEILERVRRSGQGSFLSVLKLFGPLPSPGLLSFPRRGVTLALDFPNTGAPLLSLLEDLDAVVRDAGGAVYPAKDARMSPENFRHFFPRWRELAECADPAFSSSFWRRVTPVGERLPTESSERPGSRVGRR